MRESAATPILAFVHIEKAAGTSLIHFLRRSFLLRYADVRPLRPDSQRRFTARDLTAYLRLNPWLRVIGGHSITPASDLEQYGRPLQYFTVMREPAARYLSQYQYWVRVLGRDLSFEQFLEQDDSWNWQTKRIAGQAQLEQAVTLIEQRDVLVGVVEQLGLFVRELSLLAGISEPLLETKNTAGSDREQRGELLSRYGEAIAERNAVDMQLYTWAREHRLPAQTASRGAGEALRERVRWSDRLGAYCDYALRKAYLEPVTGVLRRTQGMPAKGSY